MKSLLIVISLLTIVLMVSLSIDSSLARSPGKRSARTEKKASEDRGGLTIDEIIKLKKAGVSEATIQLLIEDKELPQKMKEKAFAQEHIGTWNIKDSQGKEAIIYSTGKGREEEYYDEKEYWRALELLRAIRPRPIIRSDQPPAAGK